MDALMYMKEEAKDNDDEQFINMLSYGLGMKISKEVTAVNFQQLMDNLRNDFDDDNLFIEMVQVVWNTYSLDSAHKISAWMVDQSDLVRDDQLFVEMM